MSQETTENSEGKKKVEVQPKTHAQWEHMQVEAAQKKAKENDFSEYEKMRMAEDEDAQKKRAFDPDKKVDIEETQNDTGEDVKDSETAESEETPTDADKSGEDGGEDAGKKSDLKKRAELDPWVKRRIDREKQKTEREKAKVKELESRIAALESGQGKDETNRENQADEPTARTKKEVSDEPIPEDEYDYDFPEKEDYDSEEAWLEDTERWGSYLPLKGGKKAQDDAPQADAKPTDNKQAPQNERQNLLNMLFDDVREVLEDEDTAADDLADQFFDQIKDSRFQMSIEMLEWMADHDKESVLVATEFARSSRAANRIFRRPPTQHGQLLDKLAERLSGDNSAETGTRNTVQKKKTPVVKSLRGSRRSRPTDDLLAEGSSYEDYERARNILRRGS